MIWIALITGHPFQMGEPRYTAFNKIGESMMKKKAAMILLILVLFVLIISLAVIAYFNSPLTDLGDAVIGSANTWTFIVTK